MVHLECLFCFSVARSVVSSRISLVFELGFVMGISSLLALLRYPNFPLLPYSLECCLLIWMCVHVLCSDLFRITLLYILVTILHHEYRDSFWGTL
ncbi:hypothetical protein BX070DRAFT_124190 [Coemansia spiralis]|nr:hypothetical protein BX070DRAFT_124190 [Coemansia spiralis]